MQIDISFEGDVAERHLLPALEGTQSLEGLGRSFVLIGHYLTTGTVRHRHPFSDDFQINLAAFEPGSFRTRFQATFKQPVILAAAAMIGVPMIQGPIGNFATDAIKYVWNYTIGTPTAPQTDAVREMVERRPGDIDALREAITPSAKRAHTVINRGSQNITIIGDGNELTILNSETKHYLENSSYDPRPDVRVVSVGSFNVNTRYGRVFDYEYGRTIQFSAARNSPPRTLGNLGRSLSIYSDERDENRSEKSQIFIRYIVRRALDGTPQHYMILDAWFEGELPSAPQR